jgi:hypothetical protein
MSQLGQFHLAPPACRNRYFIDDEFDMDDDWMTETESVASTTIFSVMGKTVATTDTSVDDDNVSMRSPSPEPEAVLEMDEPLRNNLYKLEFGRNLNSYSEVYKLPADEEELDRLGELIYHLIMTTDPDLSLCLPERQYDMLNSLLGDKYVPPMREVLVDDGSEPEKAVLDLGTGSGNWCVSSFLLLTMPV